MTRLHLFLDTNVFLHCEPLHEVDWSTSQYRKFSEVDLFVCRTVQREIDKLKNQHGSGRSARKARKTARLLRALVKEPKELRESLPKVTLQLCSTNRPSPKYSGELDYNIADDQIVGYALQHKSENQDVEVRLLSCDSGPAITARTLHLLCDEPEEEWRLPSEQDHRDKQIQELKKRIQALESVEPNINISVPGEDENSSTILLPISYNVLSSLTSAETHRLLQRIQAKFPPAVTYVLGMKESEIKEYEEFDYPQWLRRCEDIMASVHCVCQQDHMPEATFNLVNIGSRPARQARVEFQAKGNFSLTVSSSELIDCELLPVTVCPLPPPQPKSWVDYAVGFARLTQEPLSVPFTPSQGHDLEGHGEEEFYVVTPISIEPCDSIEFACKLWRHQSHNYALSIRIVPEAMDAPVRGQIVCIVHAENLSVPAMKCVPIEIIPHRVSSFSHAVSWFEVD